VISIGLPLPAAVTIADLKVPVVFVSVLSSDNRSFTDLFKPSFLIV